MKNIIIIVLIFFTVYFVTGTQISYAKTRHSDLYGFSIEIPDDWIETIPTKSWTYFAYAKPKSGENLNINILSARGLYSIKQVPLEQLFHPYYEYVTIVEKTYEMSSGIDLLKCIYKWKESDLRKQLEGKERLQFFVVQWIKNEKLFTLTFTDSEINFPKNLKTFKGSVNSLKFDK